MVVAIYPRLHEGQATNEYLGERSILAPHNKEVSLINAMVLSYFPSAHADFLSADSAKDTEVANTYLSSSSTLWKLVACLHPSCRSIFAH
jgi:hypothetical protein